MALALSPETPFVDWLRDLDRHIERAPGFFAGKPVVLDLAATPLHGPGLRAFLSELRERGIRVLGLEGIGAEALGDRAADLPPILTGGRAGASLDLAEPQSAQAGGNTPPKATHPSSTRAAAPPAPRAPAPAPAPEANALLITHPVRSGQSIQNLHGDVIIIGAVSSGAEIIAGGSIHVYGPLRGRAFAGINSPAASARIFCQRLEAELLAINGAYATSEAIGPQLHGKPAQAWFDGENIALAALN